MEEEGLVRRTGPSLAGRAFPRRSHDHFLFPLPLALAILPRWPETLDIMQIMLRILGDVPLRPLCYAPRCCSGRQVATGHLPEKVVDGMVPSCTQLNSSELPCWS